MSNKLDIDPKQLASGFADLWAGFQVSKPYLYLRTYWEKRLGEKLNYLATAKPEEVLAVQASIAEIKLALNILNMKDTSQHLDQVINHLKNHATN